MSNANNLSVFEYQYIEDQLKEKYNLKRKIYFDSCDVITMIQGIWHFNKDYHFEWGKFKSRKDVEIHAIAQKGWLGNINLLKPHQDELIFKLTNDDSNFPDKNTFSKDEVDSELLFNLLKEIPKENFKNPKSDNFEKYVKELKVNSKLLFKSNSILNPFFWTDRYNQLFDEKNIINLTFNGIDHTSFQTCDIFQKTLTKLERIRKGKAFSNYMDALAIAQLQVEVDVFKKSNFSQDLPIFFTGARYLRKVMLELFEEDPLALSYPHPTKPNKHLPIFRFESFFIIDPIFNLSETDKAIYNAVEDIRLIKEDLTNLISTEYLHSEASILETKVRDLIGEDADLEFFNKMWLNGGYKDFIDAILKYINYYDTYNDSIERIIKFKKANIKEDFEKELENTSLLKDIIDKIKDIHSETMIIKSDYNLPEHPSNDFGLLRFSFRSEIKSTIDTLIYSLFENLDLNDIDNTSLFNSSVTKIIDLLFVGVTKADKLIELISGISILWIYSKYDLIVTLCTAFEKKNFILIKEGSLNKFDINSFYSIFAASFAHSDNLKTEDFNNIINNHQSFIGINDYRFKLTRSFALFQLWYHHTLKIVIPEHPTSIQKKLQKRHNKILRESINLLLAAIKILENKGFEEDNQLKKMYYYLINNFLYYNIKGASFKSIESNRFIGFLTVLRDAEFNTVVWQNRFYDTIGWYYYRLAYVYQVKGELKLACENREKAQSCNNKSFKGPTPKRELSNYIQLKNILKEFLSIGEECNKAHNNVYIK
ncbi:MAG: hypothetical protein L3J66_12145 [Bacteroidales bacterium]|nr:hypothetical protein [Bacteroidales bacterium]